MPILDSSGIICCTFLMPPQEYDQKFRVRIVKIIYYHETKITEDPGHTRFICSINDDRYEYIISYNDIINHITNQEDENIVCKSKCIVAHEVSINESHRNYKGSCYNVMVEW